MCIDYALIRLFYFISTVYWINFVFLFKKQDLKL